MKKKVFLNLYRKGILSASSDSSFFGQFGIPLFAYSLRDLSGDDPTVVTLRRGGDNAEQSFTASQVQAETDIIAFANGGNGNARAKVIFNQGTAEDIIQTNNPKQPELVNGGVIRKINGVPSLFWDGANDPNVALPDSYKNQVLDVYRVHLSNISNYSYPTDSLSSSNYGYIADLVSSSTVLNQNYGSPTLYINNVLSTAVDRSDIYTEFGATSSLVQISIIGEDTTGWGGTVRIGSSSGVTTSGVFNGYIPEYIAYPTGSLKTGVIDNQKTFYSIT